MPIYVLEPPARFNHAYSGQVIERVLPLREARAACAHSGVSADACSWEIGHSCYLIIPRGGPVKDLGPMSATNAPIATAGAKITRNSATPFAPRTL